jgi:hypothetical protein
MSASSPVTQNDDRAAARQQIALLCIDLKITTVDQASGKEAGGPRGEYGTTATEAGRQTGEPDRPDEVAGGPARSRQDVGNPLDVATPTLSPALLETWTALTERSARNGSWKGAR